MDILVLGEWPTQHLLHHQPMFVLILRPPVRPVFLAPDHDITATHHAAAAPSRRIGAAPIDLHMRLGKHLSRRIVIDATFPGTCPRTMRVVSGRICDELLPTIGTDPGEHPPSPTE